MNKEIRAFNQEQDPQERKICQKLAAIIDRALPQAESKIWHRHPVWFLDGNPIVGYNTLKDCVRLLFWSGQSFKSRGLKPEGTFKAAEARYTSVGQIDESALLAWLGEAVDIQWDYKNIYKRKGKLVRIRAQAKRAKDATQ